MARRIKVDSDKLVKMVQEGTVEKKVLEKFGLKPSNHLKAAEAASPNRNKRATPVRDAAAESAGKVRVSKRGSIAISRKLAEALGLHVGDVFQVRPSKAGLSLKKLAPK